MIVEKLQKIIDKNESKAETVMSWLSVAVC